MRDVECVHIAKDFEYICGEELRRHLLKEGTEEYEEVGCQGREEVVLTGKNNVSDEGESFLE